MRVVNYTQFRDNMKRHLDYVTDTFDVIVVTRKRNNNVVIISEDNYNTLMENIHTPEEVESTVKSWLAL